MKKITTHSKSGLFLMEMIFVLLFLGLTCGVCVRLFAASYMARVHAREDSHIQIDATCAVSIACQMELQIRTVFAIILTSTGRILPKKARFIK